MINITLKSYVNLKILVWFFGAALLFTLYFLIRGRYKEKYLERKERVLEQREKEFKEFKKTKRNKE